jgi:nitroreductase
MIKGSSIRTTSQPIDPLFIDRWSPRSMTGAPLTEQQLLPLFEAARWAPSSGNFQPWRMLYALRDTPHWPVFFELLAEGNRPWAVNAGALVLFASRTHLDDGRPAVTHSYDTGAAWQNFALQGWLKGYVVHGMQGFDYERARTALRIPAEYCVEAMAAIGYPGERSALPEKYQARETPNARRPLEASICAGPWTLR